MNTTKTTPPHKKSKRRQILLSYNEREFAEAISKIKPDFFRDITVSVFAIADQLTGKCENLFSSDLQGEDFDKLARNAAYALFEGNDANLREIGVITS